jgi:hypothetical protein
MGWHGNRHSGGVKGTKLIRTDCPACGRNTAGGTANVERTAIWLKRHNNPATGRRCSGSGMEVRWR